MKFWGGGGREGIPGRPYLCMKPWKWLGMRWRDQVYGDCMCRLGSDRPPKIVNALADALEWIMVREGVDHIFHYLDDLQLSAPQTPRTARGVWIY